MGNLGFVFIFVSVIVLSVIVAVLFNRKQPVYTVSDIIASDATLGNILHKMATKHGSQEAALIWFNGYNESFGKTPKEVFDEDQGKTLEAYVNDQCSDFPSYS